MEEILKLGTIIRIAESLNDLMIIGYYPEDKKTGQIYTYFCINADVGISLRMDGIMIDQDKITEIVKEGYSDKESDEFRTKLRDYMRTPRV